MAGEKQDKRASMLPQVEKVLQTPELAPLLKAYRRDVVVRMVRDVIGALRDEISRGKRTEQTKPAEVAESVKARLDGLTELHPHPVVNATGIILHTNLGRSILSESARDALVAAAGTYCDLELDLDTGERTRRDIHLEKTLRALFGCEAATVVNNNAGAVMLALNTLADGREVITSRGELIEIGGSFRVPDVVAKSGAILCEVGTTNRAKISDYESAINENTAILLKTHTSNYKIVGFTEEVSTADLAALGKKHGIPVVMDLGSGYCRPEDGECIDEPDIAGVLADGPDVLTFSCDKLLWGPQGGIALGKNKYIGAMRKNPLWRVVRIDKLAASALHATLIEHMKPGSFKKPGEMDWIMCHTPGELASTADELAKKLRDAKPKWRITVTDGAGSTGGGSVPGQEIPSKLIAIEPDGIEPGELDIILRAGDPPVIGYFHKGGYVLNVLTLLPGDVDRIAKRFKDMK
jgi:L-seryl-tRNA(Ser) seleniumtransferase